MPAQSGLWTTGMPRLHFIQTTIGK
jgi:hypothetical protein